MTMIRELIEEVAGKYKVHLIQVQSGDKHCQNNGEDSYINKSFICGNTIELGIYEDGELKLLSFFHELGHFLDPTDWSINADRTTKHKAERAAWNMGYMIAEENGVHFSSKAIGWGKEQLDSYIHKEKVKND